jgi:CRP/FNR family transcriptional regulator, cyclic AMP receptor protein
MGSGAASPINTQVIKVSHRAVYASGIVSGGCHHMSETIEFSLLAQRASDVRSFKPGEAIFRRGDPALEFFVVETGKVEIRLGEEVLATVSENGIFGEMALIDGRPRTATAIAATDVRVVPVDEQQFLFLVRHTPYFALNVMRVVVQRLRAMIEAKSAIG